MLKIGKIDTNKKKRAAILVGAFVVAAIGAIFSFGLSATDKVLDNVFVLDTDVGNMKKTEVISCLKKKYETAFLNKNIAICYADTDCSINLSELEAFVDFEDTVCKLDKYINNRNILHFMHRQKKEKKEKKVLPLSVKINEQKFAELLDCFALGKETQPVETEYFVDNGSLFICLGRDGLCFDRKSILNKVKNELSWLHFNKIYVDVEEIKALPLNIDKLCDEINAPPVDAYYRKENGNVVIVPGKFSATVEKALIEETLKEKRETYEIPIKVSQPSVTAADLEKKLFRDKLSNFATTFNLSYTPRVTNLRNAAQKINGAILMPGEIFSFNAVVGQRTVANGFTIARVYVGNKVEDGIGGGICQVSSTLYSSALYANLEIIERHCHSLPVSYIQSGQDATVSEGQLDYKFRNNTHYPIKISSVVSGNRIIIDILGTRETDSVVELAHQVSNLIMCKTKTEFTTDIAAGTKKISQKGINGYTVSSQRLLKDKNGNVLNKEQLGKSVYCPLETIELVNPNSPLVLPQAPDDFECSPAPSDATTEQDQTPQPSCVVVEPTEQSTNTGVEPIENLYEQ